MHVPIVQPARRGLRLRNGHLKALLPLAAGAAGIALIRGLAPTLIKGTVNLALRYNKRMSGRVDGLHLHLLRGEIRVRGIRLTRRDHPGERIAIDEVRFDVRPSSLLHRRLSGGVSVENVRVGHGD
ncbi:MAG: hypothetical protein GF331_00705 [Chitinivibrionales bacterium]|nr:hypothetical protein [Chitinivibrionales bacterium]